MRRLAPYREVAGLVDIMCVECGYVDTFMESTLEVLQVHLDALKVNPYIFEDGYCGKCLGHGLCCAVTDLL